MHVEHENHLREVFSAPFHQPPPPPSDTSVHALFWPSPATSQWRRCRKQGGWVCFTHPSTTWRYVFLRKYVLANNLFTTHRLLGWHLLTPHPFWARQGGLILATSTPPLPSTTSACSFSRVTLCHLLPSPSKTSIHARFLRLVPFLPPPPFSCFATTSFLPLCHHHLP